MRLNRLLLAPLAAFMAACSGSVLPSSPDEGRAAEPSASFSRHPEAVQLVYCRPFDEASRTATIGILGGTIKVGPHTLLIPPGALRSPATITARITKNDYSHSVLFSPAGLQFAVPALLTLSYDGCDRQTLLQKLQVVYTTDNLGLILSLLPSVNDPFHKTTTGAINHFSRYAVAY